jgi:transposase
VKDAVQRGGNEILYSVTYYPRSNPIEQYFSQVKHYIKKKSPIEFEDIKNVLQESRRKVKPNNYKKYYLHAFRGEWLRRTRRRRHSIKKKYKDD